MLTPVVFADASGTIEFSDHSEVDGRYTRQSATLGAVPGGPPIVASFLDILTQPRIDARVFGRQAEIRLVYAPRLTLTLPEADQLLFLMQTGSADLVWHDRVVRSDLTEDLQLGQTNQPTAAAPGGLLTPTGAGAGAGTATGTSASTATGTGPNTATGTQAIWLVVSRTAEAVALRPTPFTTLSMTVAYLLSGGLDTASQAVIPLQQGPRADLSLGYKAWRDIDVVTAAFAERSEFTEENPCIVDPHTGLVNTASLGCAPRADLIQASEEVRYALDRASSLSASLGASVAWTRSLASDAPNDPYHEAWFPNAGVSATHNYAVRGNVTLQAQLAPVVDFRSGFVSNRLQGTASVTVPAARIVTVHASVRGAQTVPTDDPLALTLVGGDVDAEIVADRRTAFQVGARGQWQSQAPFGDFFFAYVYFGVTASAPALRF